MNNVYDKNIRFTFAEHAIYFLTLGFLFSLSIHASYSHRNQSSWKLEAMIKQQSDTRWQMNDVQCIMFITEYLLSHKQFIGKSMISSTYTAVMFRACLDTSALATTKEPTPRSIC
jgi:hypothetical protein